MRKWERRRLRETQYGGVQNHPQVKAFLRRQKGLKGCLNRIARRAGQKELFERRGSMTRLRGGEPFDSPKEVRGH